MNVTSITPILNVADVVASIAWFERFGWKCSFTFNAGGLLEGAKRRNAQGPATFAGLCAGEGQIFLCQDAQGMRGGKPPRFDGTTDFGATWMSIWVGTLAEVDEAHRMALANGVTVLRPPTDETWGVRECRLMHPDGHVLRISAGIPETTV